VRGFRRSEGVGSVRPRPAGARTIWGEDSYNSVVMSTRRALRWLAAMVALLVFGTVVGLFWADTSDVAGSFAVRPTSSASPELSSC
jgi:hypothetical protein